MKSPTLIILAILTLIINCSNRRILYKSPEFVIYSDQVKQGKHSAIIESDTLIQSTYISSYKKPTSRKLDFKFALNGKDNERYAGNDHHLLLTPDNGRQISPVYTFGASDPEAALIDYTEEIGNLESDVVLTIRVDINPVLKAFKEFGYYTLYNGEMFKADEFEGVYIAGNTLPLSWDFANLSGKSEFKLTDADGDGIYEITITIKQFQTADNSNIRKTWTLQQDISRLPKYKSEQAISDALYNLSLEELLLDIREDGAFMAGAKWPGIWTRDISYSILLSLAIVEPEAARKSLMSKVKNQRIIQDTGTGGSWPVSSDRMVWALAAWEIFVFTGDYDWLQGSFNIIKKSAEDDLLTLIDKQTGLFYGESSFLDWREQSYPKWMDPKDIFKSQCLGTNAVHYQTYVILAKMAKVLNYPQLSDEYQDIAESIKQSINQHLWLDQKGYYGQYLYGRNYLSMSPHSETLGEALCILFDIANEKQQQSILSKTPTTPYGTTCFYPQIPNIPPYHNNGIWPFVEAYWCWAAAKAANSKSVEHSIASIYRPAALYLTNKENIVAETGDYMGTEINSNRQLWSVAGNLAIVYRIFFGLEFQPDGIYFKPFIPKAYGGNHSLTGLKYRNSVLDITIDGYGNDIDKIYLDDKPIKEAFFPAHLSGNHKVHIIMNNNVKKGPISKKAVEFAPEIPLVQLNDSTLVWEPVENSIRYDIFRNGKPVASTKRPFYPITSPNSYSEYQVMAIDRHHHESFLSQPTIFFPTDEMIEVIPANGNPNAKGGSITLTKTENLSVSFPLTCSKTGKYALDFHYSNGSGPINTSNRCAIRSLLLDAKYLGTIVFPQRGEQNWTSWGYTNSLPVYLEVGSHSFSIQYLPHNENMSGAVNSAKLSKMRLILLSRD